MNFNGLLLVNKQAGPTSHDIVAGVRKILRTKEVGHCGTLDPIASGLLVLTCGEATKLSQYITDGNKKYWVRMQLGVETDSYDVTGNVVNETDVTESEETIRDSILSMQGTFDLEVPIYSAIKKNGKKLYEYARDGKEVELPKKVMKFWDLKISYFENPIIEFEVSCSKGSYIRSLVSQIGKKLGCGATMTALERVSSEPFDLDKAISLHDLHGISSLVNTEAYVKIEEALPNVKVFKVSGFEEQLLKNGQIGATLRTELIRGFDPKNDEFVQIQSSNSGRLLAIVGLDQQKGFYLKRVFKY